MIPMQTNKHLVINPNEGEASEHTISAIDAIGHLMNKVFGRTSEEAFKPVVFEEKHVRLFLSNVEAKTIAANKFAGKMLSTYKEALDYVTKLGATVYGPYWQAKLIKNEVLLTPRKQFFSVQIQNADLIRRLKEEANGFFVIEVRNYPSEQNEKES